MKRRLEIEDKKNHHFHQKNKKFSNYQKLSFFFNQKLPNTLKRSKTQEKPPRTLKHKLIIAKKKLDLVRTIWGSNKLGFGIFMLLQVL